VTAIVFLGPTLAIAQARAQFDAVYLPPAAQGDVYQASLEAPTAIGLIDGYFESTPAVWHKEILFALSRGIHVFGAASMGALRAAELHEFGMEGVGAIFEGYRSGLLEADDEVAVAHATAENGYRVASEALVNVRATLRAAELAGIVGSSLARDLIDIAKSQFYPDRSYPWLLRRARELGLDASELRALADFLPRNSINQKQLDAQQLLSVMKQQQAACTEPKRVRFHFEITDAWTHFCEHFTPRSS